MSTEGIRGPHEFEVDKTVVEGDVEVDRDVTVEVSDEAVIGPEEDEAEESEDEES